MTPRFLHVSDAECGLAERDEHFMENPISCYHIIRRLVSDWGGVISMIRDSDSGLPTSVFMNVANETTAFQFWPGEEDQFGGMIAISRLVYMFDLDLDDMARGVIKGTRTPPLIMREFFKIGEYLQKVNLYVNAVSFYQQALKMLMSTQYNEGDDDWTRVMDDMLHRHHVIITPYLIYRKMAACYLKFGVVSLALNTLQKASRLPMDHSSEELERLERDKAHYTKVQASLTATEPQFRVTSPHSWWTSYVQLCRNAPIIPQSSKLFCEFKDTLIPIYKVKTEYIHRDPDVMRFYDIVHDSEIDWIKKNTIHLMTRSVVLLPTTKTFLNDARISESAWIDETVLLPKLSERMHVITGLNVSWTSDGYTPSDNMQILNYGLGGMYQPHYDAYFHITGGKEQNPYFLQSGDRVATMAFYLSDVQHGGATVFPLMKLKVDSVKGTAVLWWNLMKNGSKDNLSLHAGCPVLLGEKWLANKWMRYNSQMFARPCALNSTL